MESVFKPTKYERMRIATREKIERASKAAHAIAKEYPAPKQLFKHKRPQKVWGLKWT